MKARKKKHMKAAKAKKIKKMPYVCSICKGKQRCGVCIKHGLHNSQCCEMFQLKYTKSFIEAHHAKGLGLMQCEAPKPIPTTPYIPDVGKLKGITRIPAPHQSVVFGASPHTQFYPHPPKIILEGIKPIQVLRWAEQWRDAYEDLKSSGYRSFFLTIKALKAMVQHSGLPSEDWEDAYAILRALYAEEISSEAQDWKGAIAQADARRLREIEEEAKRKAAPKYVAPVSTGNEWGISVESEKGKYRIFGFHATAVIRWMGTDAWTEKDTRVALNRLGLKDISDNTIKAQLRAGRDGTRGDPAKLSKDQDERLNSIIAEPKPKEKTVGKKSCWPSKASRGRGTDAGGPESKKPKAKEAVGNNREARRARRTAKKGKK